RLARSYRRHAGRDDAGLDGGWARRQVRQLPAPGPRHRGGLDAAAVTSPGVEAALFDRRGWRAHRDRAARLAQAGAGTVDFLHAEIADRLIDRLDVGSREFAAAPDLGARDGGLARVLAARSGTQLVVAAEPATQFLAGAPSPRVAADPELVPFRDASFDLIVSVL